MQSIKVMLMVITNQYFVVYAIPRLEKVDTYNKETTLKRTNGEGEILSNKNLKPKEMFTMTEDKFKEILQNAVDKAILAGRMAAKIEEKAKFNAFQATEERLYALPALYPKVTDDKEHLEELEKYGSRRRSADICRFKKGGVRLSDEEILDTLKQDLRAKIAADEYEINTINTALEIVKGDMYYRVLSGKYFEGIGDKVLATELNCDDTTVWRNRNRMVRKVMVRLYGVEALRK
jgi:hypothetical protein